ncbi:efflux RND transporter periplasmic adaptor subunit [Halanaerobacter jeridensis]|uniref:Multidrug resistance efflux pump n=1 Tax=Halanaerobacter jeridensis TaxID=706427 RepID=A0A938XW27_9FIRM|nr:efflux RND transporter periplasmic adaptor subunit [Halanaerobacter jeridensis]MBM7557336.1 multidrug resistance efflux pump [Halanaerobacter jeridensis]
MNKYYKNIIVIALVIGLTAGIFTGCGSKGEEASKSSKEKTQENNGIPVEVIKADTGEIVNHITVTGTSEAIKSAQLTPQLQETVDKVLVDTGDRVQKGATLVQLDQEDIKANINVARAGLETAQAGLEEMMAGAREEEIDKLKAQVEQAKANYEQAESDYERYQRLYDKEVISKQQFEGIKTKYISAKNSYKSVQESLKMAQAGPTKEQIKTQRAQVKQAQAQLDTAKLNLAKTKITAPFSGLVAEVNTEEGEMVGTQPVVSIVDLSTIEIQTYVSENNVNKLELGQQVEVDFNALANKLKGRIKNISPTLNQREKGFAIKIKVNNSGQLIKSGMYAEIKIETQRSSGNLVIPKQSLLRENGSAYVFKVEANKAVKEEVTTGLTTASEVEILSGLDNGDKVITVGAERVTDGYDVRVVGGGGQ